MSNKHRGSRAAVAAMVVVAVMAMSAVSSQAAVKRFDVSKKQNVSAAQRISDSYRSLRQAAGNLMLRWYDNIPTDLPFAPVPRELTR